MGKEKLDLIKNGNVYELYRKQWNGKRALISDYPGLLDEVRKYTWTCTHGKDRKQHSYLRSSELNISLHKFVLAFLYGRENLDTMLMPDNIIEHLDNDGLNCSYENLHIISSDNNKAKAFTVDKAKNVVQCSKIPIITTDVYYSHISRSYQIQLFFNQNICRYMNDKNGQIIPVEQLILQYFDFNKLFIDWQYILDCLKKQTKFKPQKFLNDKLYCSLRPELKLTAEESGKSFLQRNDQVYVKICTDNGEHMAVVEKTPYIDFSAQTQVES